MGNYRPAYSFQDLEVYKSLYKAMREVLLEIVPKLPVEEKFDLNSQLRRACKAPPALVAEGYAKKHHRKHWQKYLDDAIGECNEMVHHLSVCRDVYVRFVDKELCENLIHTYDVCGKQLYKLGQSWQNRPHNPQPITRLPTHNSPK